MGFGFSVGNFITAIELANKIRKDFFYAPSQFKAVSDEVRNLSIVLQDADIAFLNLELDNKQKNDLEDIDQVCQNVLDELQGILDKTIEHSPESGVVGKRIKRVWKRLNWKPEEIDQLRSRISTIISYLNTFNKRDNLVKLVQHQEDQRRQTVLDWLTPVDYASQLSDFISRREAGTGQWLLKSAEFQAWVKTDKQVLFCPGMPGAGKTILSSIVVDYLYTNTQNNANIGIAYLYCNYRRYNEQKAQGLLASLLKQLAQGLSPLPESLKSLYNSHKTNQTRPTFNEISSTLQSVCALYSRSFIVIDALDECQVSNGCRTKFLAEIFTLQAKSRANIFTTSRFIPEIDIHFKSSIRLEIRATDHDVRRYLDSQMSHLPMFVQRRSELQSEIKARVVKAVNGMFLLAHLYIQSLIGRRSVTAIRNALEKLSTGSDVYDYIYKDAMERIEHQFRSEAELAKQVLLWITCAKRPLTTVELTHALAVELGEFQFDEENLSLVEDIVSVCAGLVTVDEESAIIRLVHYTTQEYFDRTRKDWFPDAETDIAGICVTYLSFSTFNTGPCVTDAELEERLQSHAFYDYAARNWGHHARAASAKYTASIVDLLGSQAKVSACSQAMMTSKCRSLDPCYVRRVSRQIAGAHLAAYFGLEEVIIALIADGFDLEVSDIYGRAPLSWAAENGHETVVKLLLKEGTKVDTKDSYGQTPLSWAARSGQEAVVQLLLERGAEVDTKDRKYSRTPLSWGAENGHGSVAKLLLDNGAEVDTKDSYNQTPLSWAAENGHVDVVKLLLEMDAEVDTKDTKYSRTPLSWAAENGHVDVVKLLLERGAEVGTTDISGRTPLFWAAGKGYEVVEQLLLSYAGAYNRSI